MPAAEIQKLTEFGKKAGDRLTASSDSPEGERFDFDEHRWRRALVFYARIEQSLEELGGVWNKKINDEDFGDFLRRYSANPASYDASTHVARRKLIERLAALAALGEEWSRDPIYDHEKFPKPPTDLRITPRQ